MSGIAPLVAIPEDHPGRIVEMQSCLADALPQAQSIFFESASTMTEWLGQNLGRVVLISLDHDLPLRDRDGLSIDCGTGRQVAEFLAALPPTCPVIVHSSNRECAPGMFFALEDAGWPVRRIYPCDEEAWIRDAWAGQVRKYVQDGWIRVEGGE